MKTPTLLGAVTLLLVLGSGPMSAAQDKPKGDAKPRKGQPAKPPKPASPVRNDERRPRAEAPRPLQLPQRPWRQRVQPQYQQRDPRPARGMPRVSRDDQRGVWQQYRARTWRSEHRSWQQRGGYQGYRLPDMRYRTYFGPDHAFRLFGLPLVIVLGSPRFQVGDAWFSLLDPWPEDWSADWYETDDVYIEDGDDGYYLYNRNHPEVRLAVTIYEN